MQRIGKVEYFTTPEIKLFLIETFTRDLRRKRTWVTRFAQFFLLEFLLVSSRLKTRNLILFHHKPANGSQVQLRVPFTEGTYTGNRVGCRLLLLSGRCPRSIEIEFYRRKFVKKTIMRPVCATSPSNGVQQRRRRNEMIRFASFCYDFQPILRLIG